MYIFISSSRRTPHENKMAAPMKRNANDMNDITTDVQGKKRSKLNGDTTKLHSFLNWINANNFSPSVKVLKGIVMIISK